jgi:hypothetical protein
MQNNKVSTVLKLSLAFGLMGTTNEVMTRVKFNILRGFFEDLNYLPSVIQDPCFIQTFIIISI